MVMTAAEATALIETRDRTGRLLVVAFQGSLSAAGPRGGADCSARGELGRDPQRQRDRLAGLGAADRRDLAPAARRCRGGGFLFDTGAHMLNTVADLAGEDFAEVAAWLEDDGRPVDIRAVVMARLASGALVTMNGCGSAIPSCHSDIRVFTAGAILRTGIWGETLEIQRSGASAAPARSDPSRRSRSGSSS